MLLSQVGMHGHPAASVVRIIPDRRALDAGMDGFAVKPIGKSEVCHLFATFVDAKIDE